MRRVLLYMIVASAAGFVAAPLASGAPTDAGPSDASTHDAAFGRLPPELIQRVVRARFGAFKLCYTEGLRNNPSLAGRIAIRFVIDRTGHVSESSDHPSSDLPDPNVRKCVADKFKTLEFPLPDGGVVTVIYPLIFAPGEANATSDAGTRDATR